MTNHKTYLDISKKEFGSILKKQIQTGAELIDIIEFNDLEKAYGLWNAKNEEILKNSFSIPSNEYLQRYEDQTAKETDQLMFGKMPLNKREELLQKIKWKIDELENINVQIEYMREKKSTESKTEIKTTKKVFISHSTEDAKIAELFQEHILIGALTIKQSEIFNSSSPGMKVKIGEDWREAIKTNLLSSEIIFLVITSNYFKCEVCLCEMGAAWASEKEVIPIIHPSLNFEEIGVLIETSQAAIINNDEKIDDIKDKVQRLLKISNEEIPSARWSLKKREFLTKINLYFKEEEVLPIINRQNFEKIHKENQELNEIFNEQLKEKEELKDYIKELEQAKDKEQVIEIQKEHGIINELENFYDKCKEIGSVLRANPSIINGIIFKDYCRADVNIQQTDGYTADLEDYKAKKIIFITPTSDGVDYEVNWENRKMKKLKSNLDKFNEFIKSEEIGKYDEDIENELETDFDTESSDFWKKAFGISISFDY